MYQTNQFGRGLRSTLLLGAASVAAIASPAAAQDKTVETVVVTGSRIPQQGLYSTSPVTAVGRQELELTGATDVGTLLNNLPSVYASQSNFTGNNSSGTESVDLRGLGDVRTLVLIDGKRMGPGDPVVATPDIHQIPAALIDHVEVLTGGASAVYGSDAEAGVVNFIMRKDFEGVEIDGQWSGYQHDNGNTGMRALNTAAGNALAPNTSFDGQQASTTLIIGTNSADGKGNVTAYFSYQNTQQVLGSARDYSSCSLNSYKKSGTTDALGRPKYDGFVCAGSFNKDAWYPVTGPSAYTTWYMKPGGTLVPFSGAPYMYFNYGPFNSTLRPDTRYEAGAFAHYEINKSLDVYGNFMFMDDHTTWQAAPSALFFGAGPSANSGAFNVNCNNPLMAGTGWQANFCPGGVASAAIETVYSARRNIEGQPRVTDFEHTSYRIVLGAKGELSDGWSYDMSGMYAKTLYTQAYLNDLSAARTQEALLVNPAGNCTSGNPDCVPLDIFHGVGGITQSMLTYITGTGLQNGYVEEQNLGASMTGNLGQYGIKSPWAQEGMGVAFGVNWGAFYIQRRTSDNFHHADLMGSGGTDLGQPRAGYNVSEGFGEIRMPVVQNAPYAEDLSINAGYRYSSYSNAGAVSSYKYGVEWQPVDDFRIRASFQRAVRAPNVLELFTPQESLLYSGEDPCAGPTPSAPLAGCVASGLPAAKYGNILNCPASQCKSLQGGNTNLTPETSDTRSIGIVLTPTFINGFTATVDYFDIKIDKAISTVGAATIVTECTNLVDPALCAFIHRDTNGYIFTNTGYVQDLNTNTGYLQEKGIDFEMHYTTDLEDWGMGYNGSLAFHFTGTYVDEYLVQPYTGASVTSGGTTYENYDCAGYFGVTCGNTGGGGPIPVWRHTLRVTWSTPWDVNLSVAWRHIAGTQFDGNSMNPFLHTSYDLVAGGSIGDYNYFDLAGTWTVAHGVMLRAGVNNLLDKDPPTLASGGKTSGVTGPLNNNTFPGVYDPLGRYVFVGGTIKF